jgi:NAD(P)-dependent dehydrogenase (short-subunit alcohol dehydrogenase family)
VPTRTALVSGAGRGIGRAAVERFLADGWRAVAGVRDLEAARAALPAHPRLVVTRLDVADPDSVRSAVRTAEEAAGGPLHCLVNNAGYAVMGAQEDADLDAVRAMFETNLFGAAALVQAALPGMREAGRGVVVNVSSIGAQMAHPLFGFYQASKFALAALSEALAMECRPFGIRVTVVEPGMVATDFPRATRITGALACGEGPYADLRAAMRGAFDRWRRRGESSAEGVARAIVAAAGDPRTPFRVQVGDDARKLARARRALGDEAFREELIAFLGIDWPAREPAP